MRSVLDHQEIVASPVYREVVSASDFIRVLKTERANIASVRIVPARLGGKGFGQIVVHRKKPVYKTLVNGFNK